MQNFTFQEIKGYPKLRWDGKKPFTGTNFYPAQLKEKFGEPRENWINKIFWGDNLQVMSHLLKEFRGQVKLIYIDPPFDSKADYKKKIKLKGQQIANDSNCFEEKQYGDIWTNDSYLQFMYERLIVMRELLSENGFIFLHCDSNRSHYLKIILDEIFGMENFRNEILVRRIKKNVREKEKIRALNEAVDYIICFSKIPSSLVLPPEKYDPRPERWHSFEASEVRRGMDYELFGLKPNPGNHWRWSKEKAEQAIIDGILRPNPKTGKPEYKIEASNYSLRDSLWDDITGLAFSNNYPTEKKEELLENIIKMSTDEGDIVFDCFMGSGTTQAVAMKLGRKFLGADINLGAIQTTTKRLLNIKEELESNNSNLFENEEPKYTSFEVYNVNHYDFFRNELEAKELLLEALEIQKFEKNIIFDGEKDGRLVKIMPVNRITTRAELSPIISNLDYKKYHQKQDENPNKPVEKITLVCMGHEPDLKAVLENELKPLIFDIEIVDILRDKADLQFKRESEAEIVIENGYLKIENFYPMNLLQKLGYQKETVEDWKELVESIFIDWNYDGAILEPTVLDIPDKNQMVEGVYKIPEGAGTIKIKITDLLSESLELEVSNG